MVHARIVITRRSVRIYGDRRRPPELAAECGRSLPRRDLESIEGRTFRGSCRLDPCPRRDYRWPMKFAVLQFFSWPERRVDLGTVYARALERIEIMDRTGYDAVWLAEHHFSQLQRVPVGAHGRHPGRRAHAAAAHRHGGVAGARSTIRCGSPRRWRCSTCCRAGGSIGAPAAVLPGSSSRPSACRPRRAPRGFARRSRSCCAPGPTNGCNFAGEHFRFDGIEVLPKPMQSPHPPVWMAASSEGAIDWAAGRGFSILMDPHSSAAEIGRKRRRYAEQLAAAGFSEAGRDIPVARLVALGRTCRDGGGDRPQWRRMDRQFLSRRAAPPGHAKQFHARGGRSDPPLSRRGHPARHARARSATRSCGCATRSASTTCCARRSATKPFMLLTDEILPRLG